MQPQLQGFEVEPMRPDDDDLPVEHAALRQHGLERLDQLRIVAGERLGVAALDEQVVAVTEDQCPEAVPLRLEEQVVSVGKFGGELRQHGLDGRGEWITGPGHDVFSLPQLVRRYPREWGSPVNPSQ